MTSSREQQEARYYGMQIGVVVHRNDPLGLGRVRLRVPGILDEPSGWARQLTLAGHKQHGSFVVPPEGAEVAVFFHDGDPQQPFYLGSSPGVTPGGGTTVPEDVAALPVTERPDVAEFDTSMWKVTIDDRPDASRFTIRHKKMNLILDLDAKRGAIEITSEASLILKSTGLLSLDGAQVQIGGRTVLPTGKPIG